MQNAAGCKRITIAICNKYRAFTSCLIFLNRKELSLNVIGVIGCFYHEYASLGIFSAQTENLHLKKAGEQGKQLKQEKTL
jgi:hypothetical protein